MHCACVYVYGGEGVVVLQLPLCDEWQDVPD